MHEDFVDTPLADVSRTGSQIGDSWLPMCQPAR